MGNKKSNTLQKTVIWIDADIDSFSNKKLYNDYLSKKFNAFKFKTIRKGIELLNTTKEFTSITVLISGKLYNDFYISVNKNKDKIKFSIIVIVYLRRENLFIQNLKFLNMYQKDNFLSPKYITNSIINLEKYLENKIIKEKELTFENIEKYDELILPTYFPFWVNEITKIEILYFHDYIKRKYPNSIGIKI